MERKWVDMSVYERQLFAQNAALLSTSHASDIQYFSITVKKENVQAHIRSDPNKLYNYMISLSLTKEMSRYEHVQLFPDARSIKVGSGNSLHDYLQTKLWFEKNAKTVLQTTPTNSSENLNVQFADMLSGVVQGHFEDGNSEPWAILGSAISHKRLFF